MAAARYSHPLYSAHEIRSLSVRSHRDPRTVVAVIEGRATSLATAAVMAAAGDLGIEIPRLATSMSEAS